MSLTEIVKQSASANADRRVTSLSTKLDQLRQSQTVESLAEAMVPILRDLAEMPEAMAGHLLPVAESLDRMGQQTSQTLAAIGKATEARATDAQVQAEATRKLLGHAQQALKEQTQTLAAARMALNKERQDWQMAMDEAIQWQTWLLLAVLVASLLSPIFTVLMWKPISSALTWIGLLA